MSFPPPGRGADRTGRAEPPPVPTLQFPAVYHAADQLAIAGRRRSYRLLFVQLVALTAAAGFAAINWHLGSVRISSGIASLLFLIALVLALASAAVKPERSWYIGRAVAESVKSLTWLYAVGGDPFAVDTAGETEERLASRLQALASGLGDAASPPSNPVQIDESVRRLRRLDMVDRRAAYLEGRVNDQVLWYSSKAESNRVRARGWIAAFVVVSGLGIVGAGLEAADIVEFGFVSLLAAIAASFSAWTQAKQHSILAASYALASQELVIARFIVEAARTEREFAIAAGDAEDAISREHATWVARTSAMTLPG